MVKEIKNASDCIVELYKHAGILKTREKCIEKHEAQPSISLYKSWAYNLIVLVEL